MSLDLNRLLKERVSVTVDNGSATDHLRYFGGGGRSSAVASLEKRLSKSDAAKKVDSEWEELIKQRRSKGSEPRRSKASSLYLDFPEDFDEPATSTLPDEPAKSRGSFSAQETLRGASKESTVDETNKELESLQEKYRKLAEDHKLARVKYMKEGNYLRSCLKRLQEKTGVFCIDLGMDTNVIYYDVEYFEEDHIKQYAEAVAVRMAAEGGGKLAHMFGRRMQELLEANQKQEEQIDTLIKEIRRLRGVEDWEDCPLGDDGAKSLATEFGPSIFGDIDPKKLVMTDKTGKQSTMMSKTKSAAVGKQSTNMLVASRMSQLAKKAQKKVQEQAECDLSITTKRIPSGIVGQAKALGWVKRAQQRARESLKQAELGCPKCEKLVESLRRRIEELQEQLSEAQYERQLAQDSLSKMSQEMSQMATAPEEDLSRGSTLAKNLRMAMSRPPSNATFRSEEESQHPPVVSAECTPTAADLRRSPSPLARPAEKPVLELARNANLSALVMEGRAQSPPRSTTPTRSPTPTRPPTQPGRWSRPLSADNNFSMSMPVRPSSQQSVIHERGPRHRTTVDRCHSPI